MVKKFGASATSRAGTGKIQTNDKDSSTKKWTAATASQLGNNSKNILVKNLPITAIKTDQDNPRKLAIGIQDIVKISEQFPLSSFLNNEEDNDWIEGYIEKVAKDYPLLGKQIGDFNSIVQFSTVLRSAERLLHPIVVWQEDSIFHLISGERRLLTHALLGETYISSKIHEEQLTRFEIDLLQWEENIHREDMTIFEKTLRIRKLIDSSYGMDKISVRKLAKISGLSTADSQRYLVIIRYPTDTLIKAIENGRLESLQKAAALAQLSDEELQSKLAGKQINKTHLQKPLIKISRNADQRVMAKMINAIVKEYKAESALENLDLSKPKELNIAFNSLVQFLSEE